MSMHYYHFIYKLTGKKNVSKTIVLARVTKLLIKYASFFNFSILFPLDKLNLQRS